MHIFFPIILILLYYIFRQDQLLNSTYSQSGFTLDEGETLLKEMQNIRQDLGHYKKAVDALCESSLEVIPLKQRRSPLNNPIAVKCICTYNQVEVRYCHLIICYSLTLIYVFSFLYYFLFRSVSTRMKCLN